MPATYALTRSAPTAARITAVGSALQAIAAGLVVAVLIGSIFGFAAKIDARRGVQSSGLAHICAAPVASRH